MMMINDQLVKSGIDPEFNSLRVLPPSELTYPDFGRDGIEFYDKINCPHLKAKYIVQDKCQNGKVMLKLFKEVKDKVHIEPE